MRPQLDIRVLGPFEVRRDDEVVPLRAKQRALLAVLLLKANEVVPRDRLVEEVWPEGAPAAANNALQVYVSQLRKLLEPGSSAAGGYEIVLSRPPGYLLRLEDGELDSGRFERLFEEGRQALAATDLGRAQALLDEALRLWRGAAFGELAYEAAVQHELARLEELRLEAAEARAETRIALGEHTAVISELEVLVSENPLRERLRELLMVALYRSGRQAEALSAYQQARRLLLDELGIEPSPALQRLERAILNQDSSLEAPAPPADSRPEPLTPAVARTRELRKTVTVFQARLTSDAESARDPEAQRIRARRALEQVEEVVSAHGGHLDRRTVDELTAVFGLPAIHEDDVLRAARAALRARELAPVRVGLATGSALVAESEERSWLVAGAPAANASALAHRAGAGDVLVDDGTREALEKLADVTRAGEDWRLVAVHEVEAVPRRHGTPLVGRQGELTQLEQAFQRAERERTCHLFTLLGPAGIGKSRLAQELRRAVESRATVLTGRSLSYGDGITYWPLLEVVRQAVGDDVGAGLREFAGGTDESLVLPLLAAFGLADADVGRDEMFLAGRRLLELFARDRPLVVVFDDLHWAEQSFLDFVEHVATRSRSSPILVVALSRPELLEARPNWGAGTTSATTLLLGPLDRVESRTLLDILSAGLDLSPRTERPLLEAAEGNPLYLEQLLAYAADDPVGAKIGIPPTIEALLAARLDLLPRAERVALERAAIVGREFSTEQLHDLLALDGEVALPAISELLGSLVQKRLIRALDDPSGRAEFSFEHQLIRDVAEGALPRSERAVYHERIAESLDAEPVGELDELIGYHLEQASLCRRSLEPDDERAAELAISAAQNLSRAGRRAYRRDDMAAAATLLRRALDLDVDAARSLPLKVDLGDALRDLGRFVEAEQTLEEAIALARECGEAAVEGRATAIWLRGQIQTSGVSIDDLERQARETISRLEELGDDVALATAWTAYAWIPWVRCRAVDAEVAVEHALAAAERSGGHREQVFALNLYIGAAVFGPLPLEAGFERCRAILDRPALPPRLEALAHRALGALNAFAGEFEAARGDLARDREIAEELGLPILLAIADEIWGIVELLADRPQVAEARLRDGMAILEPRGERSGLHELGALLAEALYVQERFAEAEAITDEIRTYGAADDVSIQVKWRGPAAKLAARVGRSAEAEALAREAVSLAEKTDFLNLQANAYKDLGEVLELSGRGADATLAFREALARYERKGNRAAASKLAQRLASAVAPV